MLLSELFETVDAESDDGRYIILRPGSIRFSKTPGKNKINIDNKAACLKFVLKAYRDYGRPTALPLIARIREKGVDYPEFKSIEKSASAPKE